MSDVVAENKLLKEKLNSLQAETDGYVKLVASTDAHFEQQLGELKKQVWCGTVWLSYVTGVLYCALMGFFACHMLSSSYDVLQLEQEYQAKLERLTQTLKDKEAALETERKAEGKKISCMEQEIFSLTSTVCLAQLS